MEFNFDKESVGSNISSSTPPINARYSSYSSGTRRSSNGVGNWSSPQQGNRRFGADKDSCFYCHKQGHWVKDCPEKSPKSTTSASSSQPTDDRTFPDIHCPCGGGICTVRVSRTAKNPGRKFYSCPLSPDTDCGFFEWCDKLTTGDIIDSPVCRCGAGPCRVYLETSGPVAGQKFFVCPIKKGQGACKFRVSLAATKDTSDVSCPSSTLSSCHKPSLGQVSLDEEGDCNFIRLLDATIGQFDGSVSSPQSTLVNFPDTSPSNSDVVEEGYISGEGIETEPPAVESPEHSQNLGIISELPRIGKLDVVNFQEDEGMSDIPLQRHCRRLQHGALKVDDFILDFIDDSTHTRQSKAGDPALEKALSASQSEALIRRTQPEFLRQMSSAEGPFTAAVLLAQDNLETTAWYQLGFKGWFGRLVFSPSRCLTIAAPEPFFCCVFPSFDPIDVPRDANVLDVKASAIVTCNPSSIEANQPSLPTTCQLSASSPKLSTLTPPPKDCQENIMATSISEVFEQAANRLRNDLLSLLLSMDFHEYKSMRREANIVFGALEGLSVDYQPFRNQVEELISHAESLAEVESSIHEDGSSQQLVDRFDREKLHLQDMCRLHSETSAALKSSDERLESVKKEASRVKKMLLLLEEDLHCCEVENVEIRTRLDQISKERTKTELSVLETSKETEKALKLREQREAEFKSAKAAFEKARSNLRTSL